MTDVGQNNVLLGVQHSGNAGRELVDGRLALLQEHDLLRDVDEVRAVRRTAGVEFGGESCPKCECPYLAFCAGAC